MNSQTTEEPSQLLNKAISNARNKTEEQRKVLEKRYASDVKAVRDNIDKTFAQHEKDAQVTFDPTTRSTTNPLQKRIKEEAE
ncbi:hypothetical protein EJ08DRAFT_697938 [Tothia fuscella]|uniref:Uncharacterized protein n=1 Tax=Tothia fuscella TaxID=1048955 RepID=A0A9P4NRF0_9PEZI|nr:hypothetical protein EJ08DRAFT_697938 [Tothia fuscella]